MTFDVSYTLVTPEVNRVLKEEGVVVRKKKTNELLLFVPLTRSSNYQPISSILV